MIKLATYIVKMSTALTLIKPIMYRAHSYRQCLNLRWQKNKTIFKGNYTIMLFLVLLKQNRDWENSNWWKNNCLNWGNHQQTRGTKAYHQVLACPPKSLHRPWQGINNFQCTQVASPSKLTCSSARLSVRQARAE